MEFRKISAAKSRLATHMKGSGFDRVKNKVDVTMWSAEPLVVVEIVVHEQCHHCWGVIQNLHKLGLHEVTFQQQGQYPLPNV